MDFFTPLGLDQADQESDEEERRERRQLRTRVRRQAKKQQPESNEEEGQSTSTNKGTPARARSGSAAASGSGAHGRCRTSSIVDTTSGLMVVQRIRPRESAAHHNAAIDNSEQNAASSDKSVPGKSAAALSKPGASTKDSVGPSDGAASHQPTAGSLTKFKESLMRRLSKLILAKAKRKNRTQSSPGGAAGVASAADADPQGATSSATDRSATTSNPKVVSSQPDSAKCSHQGGGSVAESSAPNLEGASPNEMTTKV